MTCYNVMLAYNLLLVTSVILCNTAVCVFSLSGSGRLTCLVTLMLGVVITGRVLWNSHQKIENYYCHCYLCLKYFLIIHLSSHISINHQVRSKLFICWNSRSTRPVWCIFLSWLFLLIYFQQDATLHSLFISGKLLYMFQMVSPPTSGAHTHIYNIWYLSNCNG